MADKIMPDEYVGVGDAFGRLGVTGFSTPLNLICIDCAYRVTCNKSPLRRWCAECKKFGCVNYHTPKIENGTCSSYRYTTFSDSQL